MRIVFLRSAERYGPRIQKLVKIVKGLNSDVHFVGAKREKVEELKFKNFDEIQFHKVGVFYKQQKAIPYFYGTMFFILGAIKKLIKLKPSIIHASDLEGALPVYTYKALFNPNVKIIVNVHDNFHARYNWPFGLNKLIKQFESFVYSKFDKILFPNENRLMLFEPYNSKLISNSWFIPNAPPYRSFKRTTLGKSIRIFIAGFLSETRGLNIILDTIRNNENFELHIAGRMTAKELETLKSLERVEYHGVLEQKEVLDLAETMHVFPVLYEPSSLIHKYASPNKLLDAYCVGRPVITNEGILISNEVLKEKSGLVIEYGNSDILSNAIMQLCKDQTIFDIYCENSRKVYDKYYQWESHENKIREYFLSLMNE